MKSLSKLLLSEDMKLPQSIRGGFPMGNDVVDKIVENGWDIEEVIFRLNTSKNAVSFMGSHISNYFKRGSFGLIFELDNGNLLKLSNDMQEAQTSHEIKNLGGDVVKIYDVVEFEFKGKPFSLFLILMEKVPGVELWSYFKKINSKIDQYDIGQFFIRPVRDEWFSNGFPSDITIETIIDTAREKWTYGQTPMTIVDNHIKHLKDSPQEVKDIVVKIVKILQKLKGKGIEWMDSHFGNLIIDPQTKKITAIDMGLSSSDGKIMVKKLVEIINR